MDSHAKTQQLDLCDSRQNMQCNDEVWQVNTDHVQHVNQRQLACEWRILASTLKGHDHQSLEEDCVKPQAHMRTDERLARTSAGQGAEGPPVADFVHFDHGS